MITFLDGNFSADTQEFIGNIQDELAKGKGFIPLIGAGFSAPSGAPLLHDITEYLQRCICLALGAEGEGAVPWNPRFDQWPPFVDLNRIVTDRGSWAKIVFERLISLQGSSDDELRHLYSEAYGAMNEWKSALLFLSRLERPPRTTGQSGPCTLGAPRQEIVDSCFREALKGKHPALNHRMLATLTGALRTDLILTLNFDSLLEQAFAAVNSDLKVSEVQRNETLPHYSAFANVRALIKLHGGQSSIRVDYSLASPPSDDDKQRFLEYFLSERGRSNSAKQRAQEPYGGGEYNGQGSNPNHGTDSGQPEGLNFANHLLIMGFSAGDPRILSLIRYVESHLGPDFKVFWIYHTDSDNSNILRFYGFPDFIKLETAVNTPFPDGSPKSAAICLQHRHIGLLLLHLYQSIRFSLPANGTVFSSVSRIPLPPLRTRRCLTPEHQQISDGSFSIDMTALLQRLDRNKFENRVVIVSAEGGAHGVTSACADIFRQFETQKLCLWIDMNDVHSADNLFEVILESAYLKLGLENWTPVYDATDDDSRTKEVRRLVGSTSQSWVIFLNARETPGLNQSIPASRMGWLDALRVESDPTIDNTANTESFISLLMALRKATSNVSLILLCDSSDPTSNLLIRLKQEGLTKHHLKLKQTSKEAIDFDENKVESDCMTWVEEEGEARDKADELLLRRRFLFGLALMQRPRHLAAVWSSAALDEKSHIFPSQAEITKWLKRLEATGLLKWKHGGFLWLHSRSRELLRERIWTESPSEVASIHVGIAKWYEKVINSSSSPGAVLETAFHFCEAADFFLRASEEDPDGNPNELQLKETRKCLATACAILTSNSFLIQSSGYSRGNCRKLTQLSKKSVEQMNIPALAKAEAHNNKLAEEIKRAHLRLQTACYEIMRATAREVGEDRKAYLRHQHCAKLIIETHLKNKHSPSELKRGSYWKVLKKAAPSQLDVNRLRWQRWSAMLAVASRSYSKAERVLDKVVGKSQVEVTFGKSNSQQQRQEILRMIELRIELAALKVSVKKRLISLGVMQVNGTSLEIAGLHEDIDKFLTRGKKLASKIRGEDHSSDAHNTFLSNWSDTRFLMHQSVLASSEFGKGKGLLAMGILGEAQAKLGMSDIRRVASERALIDLHRAETRLSEAQDLTLKCSDPGAEEIKFENMIRRLETSIPKTHIDCLELRQSYQTGNASIFEIAEALSSDSLRFLDRAEPILRERRRNVWWTTWYFERKIRAISMALWATVFEKSTPIPFLGLEAVPRLSRTTIDNLLEDAIRMIRVDSYRLATVVDAYASCAKAFQLRLALDNEVQPMPDRLDQVKGNLKSAIEALGVVRNRRIGLDQLGKALKDVVPEYREKDLPDQMVIAYVDKVIKHSTVIFHTLN